ncbi:hypothetical protein FVE89_28990 [Methylobacterium sp. 2A]|nr:hypothetical protein [Methylobacterium sp. 2A]
MPVRLALLLVLTAGAAHAAGQPARARLCPENLPEGVRLPPQPGCTDTARTPPTRRQGVYDLGDGTTLQIGGRASAEYGVRR